MALQTLSKCFYISIENLKYFTEMMVSLLTRWKVFNVVSAFAFWSFGKPPRHYKFVPTRWWWCASINYSWMEYTKYFLQKQNAMPKLTSHIWTWSLTNKITSKCVTTGPTPRRPDISNKSIFTDFLYNSEPLIKMVSVNGT